MYYLTLRKYFFLMLCAILYSFSGYAQGVNDIEDLHIKRVVHFTSNNDTDPWTSSLISSFKRRLNTNKIQLDLRNIYLDPKISDSTSRDITKNLAWNLKNLRKNIDAVIVSGYYSIKQLLEIDSSQIPDIPIVFVGIYDTTQIKLCKQMVGVIQKIGARETVETSLKLFPNRTNFVICTDKTHVGDFFKKEIISQLEPLKDKITIDTLLDFSTLRDFELCAKTLNSNSMVLFSLWEQSSDSHYYNPRIYYPLILRTLNCPTLTLANNVINAGFVGGNVISQRDGGRIVSNVITDIFNGANAKDFGIITVPSVPMYDELALDKNNINKSLLPSNTILFNIKVPFLKKHKTTIISTSIVFLFLSGIIILLLILYKQNKKLMQKATQSEKLKSAFLANISHEIRTPLNAIVGFSTLLIDSNDKQEKEKYANTIQENNTRLLNLIEDIIDMSKLDAGYVSLNFANINLNELFISVYEKYKYQVNDSINFEYNIPKETVYTYSDQEKIKYILGILISNAIKYTQKGQITFGFSVTKKNLENVTCKNNFIKIFVSDTGGGINEKDLPRAFDRFGHIKTSVPDVGLKLPIIKKTLTKLGGDVTIDSAWGIGTTIWIVLPHNKHK